jgi:hypothetical protein
MNRSTLADTMYPPYPPVARVLEHVMIFLVAGFNLETDLKFESDVCPFLVNGAFTSLPHNLLFICGPTTVKDVMATYDEPTATLTMVFSVTNSKLSCSILIVTRSVVSPTLNVNPTLFVIPCKFCFGITNLYCCNYYHLPNDFSSKFQSSMTTFSSHVANKRR